jgi:hypothetical protein
VPGTVKVIAGMVKVDRDFQVSVPFTSRGPANVAACARDRGLKCEAGPTSIQCQRGTVTVNVESGARPVTVTVTVNAGHGQ